jgi:hypothetical protein
MLPHDLGTAPNPAGPLGAPPAEVAWLEPYPDSLLELVVDPEPGPEARYDRRESIELAFVAAAPAAEAARRPAAPRRAGLVRDRDGVALRRFGAGRQQRAAAGARDAVAAPARARPSVPTGPFRLLTAHANGQPAFGLHGSGAAVARRSGPRRCTYSAWKAD